MGDQRLDSCDQVAGQVLCRQPPGPDPKAHPLRKGCTLRPPGPLLGCMRGAAGPAQLTQRRPPSWAAQSLRPCGRGVGAS